MVLAIALCASPAPDIVLASTATEDLMRGLDGADVLFIGEIHDNSEHHERQAEVTASVAPRAIVFEMLTPEQAEAAVPEIMGDKAALEEALGWSGSGWPDFAMYHPIFAAAPGARVFGAGVPREAARAAMDGGVAGWFGAADAARFGLDQPLPEAQQAEREAMQMAAHCDALPEEMLPVMVDIQRLRDAALARAAAQALEETGGPLVVIAGNGHTRSDIGAPVYLARALPDIEIRTLGQSEDGALGGAFDVRADSPAVEREDPCAAFASDG
ncbi:lipoprotein [Marinibacterium profundimaris]|uniref:Lipoprotein n=2 Tax=Marinibacterium profundimaris TaxID=1679460 RepID=A0A225NJA5_9RHOB|nr:lipoprotein [Marinibacterium profundimaris]